jgi:hypothetical protein
MEDICISITAAGYIPETMLYHGEITEKMYNKNYTKECTHLKLRWKRR